MRKKFLAALLTAAMTAAVLTGCGNAAQEAAPSEEPAVQEEAEGGEAAPAQGTEAESEAAPEEGSAAGELLPGGGSNIIYCITPSTSNAYFKTVQDVATAKGTELGYEVKCFSHDDDAATQLEMFEAAIADGAAAIIAA